MVDLIVISDIHLGSQLCQAKLLNEFLKQIETKKLIINGDLFDDINLKRLDKDAWHVLSRLRKLSKKMELIFVCGNHDSEAEHIAHLIGVEVVDECIELSGGKSILCIHGDKFDRFLGNWFTYLADWIYNFIQRLNKEWARKLKMDSKVFLRCVEEIKKKALEYKKKKGVNLIFLGHSHHADEDNELRYYNSGSWVDNICTYLEINEGIVKLKEWRVNDV
jgi:UDP-2,3-diacylglucosamine pyrophosphatase LpxH